MELRKDPITRSWVMTGDLADVPSQPDNSCRFCESSTSPLQVVSSVMGASGEPWSARAVVHPAPLYHVEGEPLRRGDGIYDHMRSIGAHEVVVENSRHDLPLWKAEDGDIERFLQLIARRIQDLKNDVRFKYVSVFKNYGAKAGQEFEHPNSQITATTFVPRRVLYELRAAREYFKQKERCVFCDIVAQELRDNLRVVELRGDFLVLGPYAPRVPYETWILPQTHSSAFERYALSRGDSLRDLAGLLRRTLRRILAVAEDFHMVLHTSPNTLHKSESLGYWKTIEEDYHWHIEILPILASKARSYTFKEVYYSPVTPETAAKRLREVVVS